MTTTPTSDPEQATYDRAADIADEMICQLAGRIVAIDGDPLDGAYAAWSMLSRILLDAGWSACDLSDAAHEMQEEMEENGDGQETDERPEVMQ